MYTKVQTTVTSLAAIMAFRMLGLFMLLPVFSLYTNQIPFATPALIGIAIGIYGLLQACFQIPFGILSDHIGRKPVITAGLILLGVGSILAALSHSIYGIIIGRALQGAGAIGSTILAMIADVTHDEDRSKAMVLVGIVIGFSFAIALIIGSIINPWFHIRGIFWTTVIFAMVGIILLHTIVLTPPQPLLLHHEVQSELEYFKNVIRSNSLLRLDFGIFALHCILTAMFISIPIIISRIINLTQYEQVFLYLIILLFTFIIAIPLIIISEKKRQLKWFFISAIILLIVCQFLLIAFHRSIIEIGIILFLFFSAFTLLEATLPSLISKIAPIRQKGTALGIYSSAQFFGIFLGGSLGGWILGHFQWIGVFIFCAIIGLLWLVLAMTMQNPPYFSTVIIKLDDYLKQNLSSLKENLHIIPGISEAEILTHENLIYLKIDKKIITEEELRKRIRESNLNVTRNY
ncbi:MFS transporter [Coxiella endosymbiont of Rhipicephalus microplus]|uniref:MFS transporter n=1 Tax=Coxiella endosymbiont of Rhipicephalus microplus TaxID=1656186 RepID=UPI000C8066CA|nr:MFS transporter [Coxiella endosymbiont of Rhipicephalus microplus]PMB54800.1 putative transport protein [Coxiella-like endosymbiont]